MSARARRTARRLRSAEPGERSDPPAAQIAGRLQRSVGNAAASRLLAPRRGEDKAYVDSVLLPAKFDEGGNAYIPETERAKRKFGREEKKVKADEKAVDDDDENEPPPPHFASRKRRIVTDDDS